MMVSQAKTARIGLTVTLAGMAFACSSGVLDQGKLPPDVQDPATLHTPAGAVARYRGALDEFPGTFDAFMTKTGILTDELADLPTPLGVSGRFTPIDSRQDLTDFKSDYDNLHRVRAQAREARGFLTMYAPDSSPALAGHLYVIEGYAEVLLADLFCSGIPLSTVDFNGDYTLAAGATTADVYRHAVGLFDSALTMVEDSVRFQHLAAVGRGRALLALGRYADAAAAVAGVPDGYGYQVVFVPPAVTARLLWFFLQDPLGNYQQVPATPSVGDREGTNGLDFRSSEDPRVAVKDEGPDVLQNTLYFPAKYPETGSVTLTLADGIEARLIEAEAALAGNADWLPRLNVLRTDGTFDTQPDPGDPSRTDTLWHAGTGGVPGLRPLEDPGNANARLSLLFRERAFWLYLTGHRQGDLRRLVREYARTPDAVYPSGFYQGGNGSGYGTEIVAPVPASERELNPKYTGCFHNNG